MGKKTKSEKEIPLDALDKAQARLRIPECLEDYEKFRKGDLSSEAFDKKYIGTEWAVVVKPHKRAKTEMVPTYDLDGKIMEGGELPVFDLGPWLREGRFLMIEIDVSSKINEVLSEIRNLILYFQKYHVVMPPKSRSKKTLYSPWEVYDLHHKDGLNFLQIARKLSGHKGNPTNNERLMAAYKNVKRAYKKACAMIKQEEKRIESLKSQSRSQ